MIDPLCLGLSMEANRGNRSYENEYIMSVAVMPENIINANFTTGSLSETSPSTMFRSLDGESWSPTINSSIRHFSTGIFAWWRHWFCNRDQCDGSFVRLPSFPNTFNKQERRQRGNVDRD